MHFASFSCKLAMLHTRGYSWLHTHGYSWVLGLDSKFSVIFCNKVLSLFCFFFIKVVIFVCLSDSLCKCIMVFYASFSKADLIIILYGYEASWPAIMLVGFVLRFTYGYCGVKGVELNLSILRLIHHICDFGFNQCEFVESLINAISTVLFHPHCSLWATKN